MYLYRDEQSEDKKLRRRKMYNDTWEQDYMEFLFGLAFCFGNGKAHFLAVVALLVLANLVRVRNSVSVMP